MKAIVWTSYGPPDVLQLREVEKPAPRDDEVLVRIRASTVTTGDCEMRRLQIPVLFRLPMRIYAGFRKPRRITILGQELAGEVESVGREIKHFEAGDPVFGIPGFRLGAYAEYICLPEGTGRMGSLLARKPSNLSFEQAAAVPVGGLEALHYLRKAGIQKGQKVLIYGAGGSIGTMAIQLARHYGAEVTAVDSASKHGMLRSLGAVRVIDHTREDFTKNGVTYDVVFDIVGKSPFAGSLHSLKKNGTYLIANPGPAHMVRGPLASRTSGRRVISGGTDHRIEDLLFLKEMTESGIIQPVIDRTYPLEQTAQAHAYVETGEKKGNVLITL